jgi:Spy/CpxP family protein refolding chaperone
MKARTGRKLRIGALAAAALAAFGAAREVQAKPPGGCGGKHGRSMLDRVERELATLGLAQKELDAAYAVIDQARSERRGLDGQIHAAHERMRELLDAGTPDASAVSAQADTIGDLMTQVRKIELRAALGVRAMLTPEQREKLESHHDRMGLRGPPPEA